MTVPRAKRAKAKGLEFPGFPSDQMPAGELITRLCGDFERRHQAQQAKRWFPVRVKMEGPIGVAFLGDPHVDDDGCNWPLLKRDLDIIRATPGMYAANIGDSENNWAGRLAHLYSQQNTSRATAKQLVEWLFEGSGVEWLVLLLGNHDSWGDNAAVLERIGRGGSPLADWQAQLRLVFPNERQGRIWAAHNFPGNSMWNPLHGAQKTARFNGSAHLYVCGHTHEWACFTTEDANRASTFWCARARGYKFLDSYAENLGYMPQQEGAAITSVWDPDAKSNAGFLHCFADLEEAAEFLVWKRQRWAMNRRVEE